jgi:hypothetical protein
MKNFENSFNKERPFPGIFNGIQIGTKPEKITNPFSNQSIELPPDAVAVYDIIMGSQALGEYDRVRKGSEWFARFLPKAYMILID